VLVVDGIETYIYIYFGMGVGSRYLERVVGRAVGALFMTEFGWVGDDGVLR